VHRLGKEKLPRPSGDYHGWKWGRWAEQRSLDRVPATGRWVRIRDEPSSVLAGKFGIFLSGPFLLFHRKLEPPSTGSRGPYGSSEGFLVSELREMLDSAHPLFGHRRTSPPPKDVVTTLNETMKATSGAAGMTLTLALSYGGRDDILQADPPDHDPCRERDLDTRRHQRRTFSSIFGPPLCPTLIY